MEKAVFYRELCAKLEALIGEERDWLANLANTAALLYQELPRINWVGFYLLKGDELVLGPFQGKPACIRIAMGKGVCGVLCTAKLTWCQMCTSCRPYRVILLGRGCGI